MCGGGYESMCADLLDIILQSYTLYSWSLLTVGSTSIYIHGFNQPCVQDICKKTLVPVLNRNRLFLNHVA